MRSKMMVLVHTSVRKSWHTKFMGFLKMPYRTAKPITQFSSSSSAMKSKKEEMAQSLNISNRNVEKQPNELSLLAKKMLKLSEHSRDQPDNENCNQLKVAESDFVSTSHSVTELKLRLQSMVTDINDTLNKSLQEQTGSMIIHDSKLMFSVPNHKAHDDSVESIMLSADIKASLAVKPSPLLGTEDPSIPPSEVPCVGCGALLQCQHNTFPGFLPSELFRLLTVKEMKVSLCQRCHYIRHCDAFVEVSTKPEQFAEMISKIRPTKSVVVMVVDVMDMDGSIIPDLLKYIGNKHPLVIVGNKADLLAPDGPGYLKSVRTELQQACHRAGLSNIVKYTLISAKTGYGIEKLINMLLSFYKQKVDVFIVGTANAGKSSLFNTLLASDYCRNSARNLIQRATISVWPGTTLNLLKFPIMRPTPRQVALRSRRLKQELAQKREEQKLQRLRKKETEQSWELTEQVNITDVRTDEQIRADEAGSAWGQEVCGYAAKRNGTLQCIMPEPTPFDPNSYSESFWTYDTPGIINPGQIMNLLTPEESPYLTPASMIVPRCLFVKPGDTVFVSGLARLDYIQGTKIVMFTVHCGSDLPIHVMRTDVAEQFYEENVGTATLGIPIGDGDRLMKLPSLIGKEFTVVGINNHTAAADIQLSSLGWVSVAAEAENEVIIRAYTPGMKGMRLRTPALMPDFSQFKGKRKPKTQIFYPMPQGSAILKNNTAIIDAS